MASAAPDAFISYSREDAEFVDRLEADLRARGFNVWVDRRRLEGSQDWEQEITRAVERYSLFIAILSKPAVQSPNVRFEHELAARLGKRIVPVLYEVCPIPSALAKLQWVDFTDANAYPRALKELIYASQDSTLDLTLDSNTLYNQALALTASNPERATILFQRILDRDPGYFGGEVANEQQRLEQRLYASRVARLRAQAEQAHQRGEYGVEAGALEAIIALGAQDAATYEWAQEYLPIAQQNRALLGPYNVILQRAGSDRDGAAERLRVLWQQAPYFRDPAGIAPALGLSVPMTYEESKERRAADATRAEKEQKATSQRDMLVQRVQSQADSATNLENGEWLSARALVQRAGNGTLPAGAESQLLGWKVTSPEFLDSLVNQSNQLASLEKRFQVASSRAWRASDSSFPDGFLTITVLTFTVLAIAAFSSPIRSLEFSMSSIVLLGGIVDIVFGFDRGLTCLGISSLILGAAFPWLRRTFLKMCANRREASVTEQKEEAAPLVDQWISLAEAEHAHRMSGIENERRRLIGEAQAQYQQRMAEIAAEHRRALTEIARRYPQG